MRENMAEDSLEMMMKKKNSNYLIFIFLLIFLIFGLGFLMDFQCLIILVGPKLVY